MQAAAPAASRVDQAPGLKGRLGDENATALAGAVTPVAFGKPCSWRVRAHVMATFEQAVARLFEGKTRLEHDRLWSAANTHTCTHVLSKYARAHLQLRVDLGQESLARAERLGQLGGALGVCRADLHRARRNRRAGRGRACEFALSKARGSFFRLTARLDYTSSYLGLHLNAALPAAPLRNGQDLDICWVCIGRTGHSCLILVLLVLVELG